MQVITAQRLVVGKGKTVMHNGAVCMENGRIKAVESEEKLRAQYPGTAVSDYGDATILPGLIDMHLHVGDTQSRPDVEQGGPLMRILFAAWELSCALKRGVTTVRDVASEKGVCVSLRQAAEMGLLRIPRIFTSGPAFAMSGGHAWMLESVTEVNGPWKLCEDVRSNIRDGADWIKIMADGVGKPEYTQEELNAAVTECHRRGRKAAVHASMEEAIGMCIEAGFDTIEHGIFMTPEQARRMAEKGIAWVPTAAVCTKIARQLEEMLSERGLDAAGLAPENVDLYLTLQRQTNPAADLRGLTAEELRRALYYRSVRAAYRERLKRYLDMGVTVLAGTDMVIGGTVPAPVEEEIACLAEYGLTVVEAIEAATGSAAQVLGLEGQAGTLEPGSSADILVVKGDASRDAAALSNTLQVFQNGQAVLSGTK